jgi:hypothetical protein
MVEMVFPCNDCPEDRPLPSLGWTKRAWRRLAIGIGQRARGKRWIQCLQLSGWHGTVTAGVATVALIANVAPLAWSLTCTVDPVTNSRVLIAQSCHTTQAAFTWTHLAINLLSALLLATSNATMQCLSAPTRQAVCTFR